MNKIWKKDYTLRASDFDKFQRIKPSAVLDLFQDAAGQHGEELGVGFDAMLERSYLWVLIRVKFKILAPLRRYQTVTVKTWPLPPNRLSYRREYCIEDENGNRLIIGSSDWVVMHSEKRRLLSVPDLYPFADGFHNEMMFEGKLTKTERFDAAGTPHIVNAGFCDLDMNNHVNNTKYANYVLDAISPADTDIIESFHIDYQKEVIEGTQLNIHHLKTDDGFLASGLNTDGETMFTCKITLKK